VCRSAVLLALTQARCRFLHWSVVLSTIVCLKSAQASSPDLHQSPLQMNQVTYWPLVHALLRAAPNLVGPRLIHGVRVHTLRRPQFRCKLFPDARIKSNSLFQTIKVHIYSTDRLTNRQTDRQTDRDSADVALMNTYN